MNPLLMPHKNHPRALEFMKAMEDESRIRVGTRIYATHGNHAWTIPQKQVESTLLQCVNYYRDLPLDEVDVHVHNYLRSIMKPELSPRVVLPSTFAIAQSDYVQPAEYCGPPDGKFPTAGGDVF